MLTEKLSPTAKAVLKSLGAPPLSSHIRANHRQLGESARNRIADSLKSNFWHNCFGQPRDSYLESQVGKEDFEDHLHRRTEDDRSTVIPWLDSARRLNGARILEIGCGTGSSTVAFAEQGAEVIGTDIDEAAIQVAKDRCEAYGLKASFSVVNATEVAECFAGERFDYVIFYASLEHMTHRERMVAMKSTWDLLPNGALWCVVEAPNRLWNTDLHTSLLPFFHWLPNDLALEYSRFSPREGFRSWFREPRSSEELNFLRLGRGVSYHEFDLAIRPCQQLHVVSSMLGFLRRRSLLWSAKARIDGDLRFESVLARIGPRIHRGFFHPRLDLVIKKD